MTATDAQHAPAASTDASSAGPSATAAPSSAAAAAAQVGGGGSASTVGVHNEHQVAVHVDDDEEEEDEEEEEGEEEEEEEEAAAAEEEKVEEQNVQVAATPAGDERDVKSYVESFPETFPSWEALEEYLKEFKHDAYQMFLTASATPSAKRNAALKKRKWHNASSESELIPEDWKYYRRVYTCTHAAKSKRYHSTSKGIRNHAALRGMGCTAQFSGVVKYDNQARCHYIRVKLEGWHNHACDREQYFAYSENRRITEPAILNKVQRLMDRGLGASAIHKRISKIITEIKGSACVLTKKDMQNLIGRLKNDGTQYKSTRRRRRAGGDEEPEGETNNGEEESAAGGEEDQSTENRPRKRKATGEITFSDSEDSDSELKALREKQPRGVKLSKLQALLESPYSYNQAHDDVEQVVTARAEQLPQTISGFRHDILQVSRSDVAPAQDIDFVLPKYVLFGCEGGVVNYCRFQGLTPPRVGIKLPVRKQELSSREEVTQVVTLGSHQLRVMKQFYLARENIQEAKRAIGWVQAAAFQKCPPPPFDDYFYHDKESILHSLKLMPLTRTVVRGKNFTANVAVEFTDMIQGANVLKFGSSANVDVDCVKAVILGLHPRFHATASFVCPSFNFEKSLDASRETFRAYGAFTCLREAVAGAVQVVSRRWGSFVLTVSTRKCYVYAPSQADFEELRSLLSILLREYVPDVVFEFSPSPSVATSTTGDSGVLALLFVELMLLKQTWADIPMDALEYFRVRYLMQAMQVVKKQDVHDIHWV